jgi:ligand-binding SRPBCC domain-containing protein
MKIYFSTRVRAEFAKVRQGFGLELFQALIPPWTDVTHERFDGCREGDEIHFTLHRMGLKIKWVSLITYEQATDSEWAFVDEGKLMPFPLLYWKHLHRVVKVSDTESEIIDDIQYRCRYKSLEKMIYPVLWGTIAIRPPLYRKYFEA